MRYLKSAIERPMAFISAGQFVTDVTWTHARRIIDNVEIIIGVNKTLYIEQDGEPYAVGPGEALLLLPGRLHGGYRTCEPDLSFYWFHFSCPNGYELLEEEQMARETAGHPGMPAPQRDGALYLSVLSAPPHMERLHILFRQLLHLSNAQPYTTQSVNYMLTSLLLELSDQTIQQFRRSIGMQPGEENLANLLEWVRIHADQELTVTAIAQRFNYNKDYLSRFFKRKFGMNLLEYLHLLKMSKAKDLLSCTNLTVKEVAAKVGIPDDKYFMKLFKRYEKITPSQFRKAYYQLYLNNE